MTLLDVQNRLEEIRAVARDDETAHHEEDSLWYDVLKAIADGAPNANELAAEALKSAEIKFARWCA